MARKKQFYPAIVDGELIGIFKTWEECKPHVTGIKGKQIFYAGFEQAEQAVQFIVEKTKAGKEQLKAMLSSIHFYYDGPFTWDVAAEESKIEVLYPENALHIYVDGSFDPKTKRYSYGFVAVENGKPVYRENGMGTDKEAAAMHQVGGEILGAEKAVHYAIEQGKFEVVLFYDYLGVEEWAKGKENGGWKAKNKFTQKYQKNMQEYQNMIDIYFVKVKAHVSKSKANFHHQCNDEADRLAKEALGL